MMHHPIRPIPRSVPTRSRSTGTPLRAVVETVPGVLSLEPFFDTLFTLALRAEREADALPRAA